ncbi:MAG: hypothetical protein NTX65_12445 [Ignavibacteriales bacterium]|nr:hypothetical protein [Ignavibacteriales bacterium]
MVNRKNILFQLLFVFSLSAIISFIMGCRGTSNKNEINGGFEIKSQSQNGPEGWSSPPLLETKNFVSFTWDSTEHHSGSHSVSIAIDSMPPKDHVFGFNWTRTFDDFIIGKKYSISGWIKTKDVWAPAEIMVLCKDYNHNNKAMAVAHDLTHTSYPIKGTSNWTLIKTNFTVPNDTKEVRILARINYGSNIGSKVWFDDIKIE